jgi:replicative DNA helicase
MCDINLAHSRRIETAILAILMMHSDRISEVARIVEPEDFYYSRDQIIFRSIYEAHAQGHSIDLVLTCHYLETKGLLQECGGAVYVASLVDGMPKSEIKNLFHYCFELRRLRFLREIQRKCYRIAVNEIPEASFEEVFSLSNKINEYMSFIENKKASNEGQNESAKCIETTHS